MDHLAVAPLELPPCIEQAKRQVGVFAVCAREPFVEPADIEQGPPTHGEVGRDPGGARQPCHVALVVGRSAFAGQRHHDLPLDGRRTLSTSGDVGGDVTQPVRVGQHVVVEEDDPRRCATPPSGIARRSRSPFGDANDVWLWQLAAREAQRLGSLPRSSTTTIDAGRGPVQRSNADINAARLLRPIVGTTMSNARGTRSRHCGAGQPSHASRRTMNEPIASRSIGADPKHSNASRGSLTIGRDAVLSDVLTTTGRPVRRSNSVSRS